MMEYYVVELLLGINLLYRYGKYTSNKKKDD